MLFLKFNNQRIEQKKFQIHVINCLQYVIMNLRRPYTGLKG